LQYKYVPSNLIIAGCLLYFTKQTDTLDELSWSVGKYACDMTRMSVFMWTGTRPVCGFCENGKEPLKIGKLLAI